MIQVERQRVDARNIFGDAVARLASEQLHVSLGRPDPFGGSRGSAETKRWLQPVVAWGDARLDGAVHDTVILILVRQIPPGPQPAQHFSSFHARPVNNRRVAQERSPRKRRRPSSVYRLPFAGGTPARLRRFSNSVPRRPSGDRHSGRHGQSLLARCARSPQGRQRLVPRPASRGGDRRSAYRGSG